MSNKIDSNETGLAYAEEATLKVLPGSPVWYTLEPNSYKDFGGQISTVARNPINPSRQRKKGVTTDLDASGGFVQDLTASNSTRLMQGFFFADAREKPSTAPLSGAQIPLTSVDAAADEYRAAAGLAVFVPGDIVLASGFSNPGNNGLKYILGADADSITVGDGLVGEASPPIGAKVEVVGYRFGAGTMSISLSGNLVRLNSTTKDMSTLGLIPGEWVYLGGDGAGNAFANNSGFARVSRITAAYLEFDKTDWEGVIEAGAGITLSLFTGLVIRNENSPALIKRRTYNVERQLGSDDDGVMSEYLVGAVPNELMINMPQADKVTLDMSFVALDNEQRSGLVGLKGGTRPALAVEDAFNTSNDFSRIKLASVSSVDSSPTPLFAFATELSVSVNNNVSPNKAVAVLGAFDTSAGTFEVGGKITAYFSSIESVQAVRNNADVTLDIIMVKNNKGLLLDIPLLSLGDGRLNIEQDKPILVPLENMAAESRFGHTLLFQSFAYLPAVAG
jgi:hypothetical protein